jgi:hypothetical protein
MIINKKVLGVCSVASKDNYRPQISSVHFTKDYIEATDGYMLLRTITPIPSEDPEDIKVRELNLPTEQLAKILRMIHTGKKIPTVMQRAWIKSIDIDKKTVSVSTSDMGATTTIEMGIPEGNFPDMQTIIETAISNKSKAVTAFNPKLMIKLLQAMILSGAGSVVEMKISEPLDGIVLKGTDDENKDILALLMPTRVNSNSEGGER